MLKTWFLILEIILLILLTSCTFGQNVVDDNYNNSNNTINYPLNFYYDFEESHMNWIGGFSKLPFDYNDMGYNIKFDHNDIALLEEESKGLMLKANNHNEEIFMYITKEFNETEGLNKNTNYIIDLFFDLATNLPTKNVSGKKIYIKTGIVDIEPKSELNEKNNLYELNLDIGNKDDSGTDLISLGNATKSSNNIDNEKYEYKTFKISINAKTNDNGQLWIILGIHSTNQGFNKLYFDNINISINEK